MIEACNSNIEGRAANDNRNTPEDKAMVVARLMEVEVVLAVDVEARSASIESLLLPLLPLEDVLLVDVSC